MSERVSAAERRNFQSLCVPILISIGISSNQVTTLRRIHNEEFSSETNEKISLLSYLLEIPEDLIQEFIEINQAPASLLLSSSKQKLTSKIQYLRDAGFRCACIRL